MLSLRAVKQSLDPAGGEVLKKIVSELPFSPSDLSLKSTTQEWLERMNKMHKRAWKLPLSAEEVANQSKMAVKTEVQRIIPVKQVAAAPPLPPESFTRVTPSQSEEVESSRPVIIKKVFAAAGGGRTGVAVTGAIPSSLQPTSSTAMIADDLDVDPSSDTLGPTAYLLDDGRCYDARGSDITNSVSSPSTSSQWLVLDCSSADGVSIVSRGSRQGSSSSLRLKPTSIPQGNLSPTPNPSWPNMAPKESSKASDEALVAAMKAIGLASLPLPPQCAAATAAPAVDMRLRPRSGVKDLMARTGSGNNLKPLVKLSAAPISGSVKVRNTGEEEEGAMEQLEADEADFEARLSRNIEAGINGSSRASPARSGVSLAPLAPRTLSGKGSAPGGTKRSLLRPSEGDSGYGEDADVEERLQRQIDSGSAPRSIAKPASSSAPVKKPPAPTKPSARPVTKSVAPAHVDETKMQDAWDAL